MIRVEAQRAAVAGHRMVQLAQALVGQAEVGVIRGLAGIAEHGPLDGVDGRLVVAPLERNHADQMQGLGVVGLGLEDLPVDLLRLLKPAGLVMAYRGLQCLGGGGHVDFSIRGNLA